MKRTIAVTLTGAVLGISGVALGTVPLVADFGTPATVAAAQNQDVTIQNFTFSPGSLTVEEGTSVTWTNKDSTAHTVTSDSGGTLASSQLGPNQTYSHTFDKAGTYNYHCSIHPQMKGTVIVTSSSTPTPTQGGSGTNTPAPSPTQGGSTPTPAPTQMGGMGSEQQQSQSGNVATGPVAAGSGSIVLANLRTRAIAFGAAVLSFLAAAGLVVVRRLRFSR